MTRAWRDLTWAQQAAVIDTLDQAMDAACAEGYDEDVEAYGAARVTLIAACRDPDADLSLTPQGGPATLKARPVAAHSSATPVRLCPECAAPLPAPKEPM